MQFVPRSLGVKIAVATAVIVPLVYRLLRRRRIADKRPAKAYNAEGASQPEGGVLDVRRKALIVRGGATDHGGEVCVCEAADFDLNRTIFKSLTGVSRLVISSSVAVELFWSDAAVSRVTTAFAKVPKPPAHNKPLLDFMAKDCNFAMEHADGSFLDHLQWCYEYGCVHFQQHSPRVLFLHSIMGVGTNFFPMQVESAEKLRALLTPEEFQHIEAFPSFVRLLYHHQFASELLANLHRIKDLKSVTFHRVIDNKPLTMKAEDLWVHLNYHIVHALDFLPASNWGVLSGSPLFQVFLVLQKLLTQTGQLVATVDFDLKSAEQSATGLPVTLGGLINRALPNSTKKRLGIKQIGRYSKEIGHSLEYKIEWA